MAGPLLLVENLLSTAQFPNTALTAITEPTGTEVFRIATGRRYARDRWTPTAANALAWIRVDLGMVRSFDTIVIDRGHNLNGKTVTFRVSNDAYVTTADVFSDTLPTASSPGPIGQSLGVLTEEGAWIKRVPLQAARYLECEIPAMGAGLRPEIVGLWIGKSFTPGALWRPLEDEARTPISRIGVSDAGWRGGMQSTPLTSGSFTLKLESFHAYDEARRFAAHWEMYRPCWFVPDTDQADRAILIRNADGNTVGFALKVDWGYRQAALRYVEHEPRRIP